MLLELINIDTYYGRAQALLDVTINLDEGEVVVLLGANGAGKSTTLLTISGILRARKGKIIFQNQVINHEKTAAIVKMGISLCPEDRSLFPNMTVQDNLKLGAFLSNERAKISIDLDRIYELFPKLLERKTQVAGSLSGGEQQMLAIGRALMSKPRLLMLDEPSLGLSPIRVDELFTIIRDINKTGTSVLLVEQNAGAALEIAHRGYVLETGKISVQGTSQELIANDRVRQAYLGG